MTRAEMIAKLRALDVDCRTEWVTGAAGGDGEVPSVKRLGFAVSDLLRPIADALEQEQRELVRVRDEMEKLIVLPDEMSYHPSPKNQNPPSIRNCWKEHSPPLWCSRGHYQCDQSRQELEVARERVGAAVRPRWTEYVEIGLLVVTVLNLVIGGICAVFGDWQHATYFMATSAACGTVLLLVRENP